MNRILLPIFILLFLNGSILHSQPDVITIDQLISETRKQWEIPGMSVGIYYKGEVFLVNGYGVKELGKPDVVDEHTLFAIASNTKAFISTILGTLVDEKKIQWSDPVKKYLPWLELYDPMASQQLNIRDLLSHRAGLGTFSGDVLWYKSERTAAEVLQNLPALEPAYPFRDGYGYSNLMFIAAGEVIQAVTGKTWHEYAKENIWDPLHMQRTTWTVNDLPKLGNAATPHKYLTKQADKPIAWTNWDNMGSAGGIISSASDMLNWIALHLNGGKWNNKTIYPTGLQTEMWQPYNSFRLSEQARKALPGRNTAGYGLGWSLMDYNGHWVVQHGGGYDGMYSKVCIVPDLDLGMVILTNSMKGVGNPLSYTIIDHFRNEKGKDWLGEGLVNQKKNEDRIANRITSRKEKRKSGTQPNLSVENMLGTYRCPLYGDIFITRENDTMKISFQEAPLLDATLEHWHFDTWEIKWKEEHAWFDFGTVQFIMDNQGEAKSLEFDVPNDDIFFEEIRAIKLK